MPLSLQCHPHPRCLVPRVRAGRQEPKTRLSFCLGIVLGDSARLVLDAAGPPAWSSIATPLEPRGRDAPKSLRSCRFFLSPKFLPARNECATLARSDAQGRAHDVGVSLISRRMMYGLERGGATTSAGLALAAAISMTLRRRVLVLVHRSVQIGRASCRERVSRSV